MDRRKTLFALGPLGEWFTLSEKSPFLGDK